MKAVLHTAPTPLGDVGNALTLESTTADECKAIFYQGQHVGHLITVTGYAEVFLELKGSTKSLSAQSFEMLKGDIVQWVERR
ncbi:hypothetical protein [Aliagarivorans taiwanensis]|uniref:hypothetical protein n=1 Tax=Aliagarivorans taiwanensis TaxID=561966 RepID=UPI00040F3CBC|nr:hypothetical protein [Aliagarivorans taiwanensis]